MSDENGTPAAIPRPQSLTGRELLTAREVAAWLTVSVRKVHRLVEMGLLKPALKVGSGSSRWSAADIEAYLADLPRGLDSPLTERALLCRVLEEMASLRRLVEDRLPAKREDRT